MNLTNTLAASGIDAMKQRYVGAVLRALLISAGAITATEADTGNLQQIAGALITLATLLWGLYEKRQSRQVLVTSLAAAQMTENQAKARVADPFIPTPSVTTAPDAIPTLTLAEVERATRPVG